MKVDNSRNDDIAFSANEVVIEFNPTISGQPCYLLFETLFKMFARLPVGFITILALSTSQWKVIELFGTFSYNSNRLAAAKFGL